jgi:predicted dehydrogenase
MSARWLQAARELPDLEVVGLVDIREEAARKRAEEFGLGNAHLGTELSPALERLRPDVVFDCTVPETHAEVTQTALRSGCHVLGEKPLAHSLEAARASIAAAHEAGKLYAVIQNRRYDRRIRRLRRFLMSGAIGRLTTVHSDFFIGAHFGGFRDRMEHVLLLDMAIHTFDMARFIAAANPVSVYCREWNPQGSWYDHDASAIAVFEMTGGIVYTYRGSWCAEGRETSWEAEWRLVGDNGTVTWDGHETFRADAVAERGGFRSRCEPIEVPEAMRDDKHDGHLGLMREFIACVRSGGIPETVCTDNIHSLEMVFGAIRSAESGSPVTIG